MKRALGQITTMGKMSAAASKIQAAIRAAQAKKRYVRRPRIGFYRTGGVFGRFAGGRPAELKAIDCEQTALAFAATGTIFPQTASALNYGPAAGSAPSTGSLVTIVQGDQFYQRIGKSITIKKISCRWTMQAADLGSTFRLLLVQDTQANGAVPTVNQVLGFTGKTVVDRDFNNLENSKRFKILYDKYGDINALTSNGATYNTRNLSGKFFKNCNIPIIWDTSATTGAIGTLRSNNLFFIALCLTGDAALSFTTRLRYQDS